MKLFTLLLPFLLISCDVSELDDEKGSKNKPGFEMIEGKENFTSDEKVLLNELCLSLSLKNTRSTFDKKVKHITRDCAGNVVSTQKNIRFDGVKFVEVISGSRTRSYESPFTKMITMSSDANIKSLCDQKDNATIARYKSLTSTIAIEMNVSKDLSQCYYNANKEQAYGEDGVCVNLVTAQKSNPETRNYDKLLLRSTFVVFKAGGSSKTGMAKYQLFIDGVCSSTSSNKEISEEVYLGP